MRISDWSSDVCSSDLLEVLLRHDVESRASSDIILRPGTADIAEVADPDQVVPPSGSCHRIAGEGRAEHAFRLLEALQMQMAERLVRKSGQNCRAHVARFSGRRRPLGNVGPQVGPGQEIYGLEIGREQV